MSADAIERLGLPIVLVLVLGLFLFKTVWPWMIKQVEVAQAQANKGTDALAGIQTVIATQNQINQRVVAYLESLERKRGD